MMSDSEVGARGDKLASLRVEVERAAQHGAQRLPPERRLARDLGVSRGGLRSLLAELAREGLIQARPQSGWHLTGAVVSEPNQSPIGFTEMSRLYGHDPHSEVLSSTVRMARESESTQLRIGRDERVWELRRLRYLGRRPVSIECITMALVRAVDLVDISMEDRSLFAEFESRGIEVTRSDVVVEAEAADEHVAELLGLAVGNPVLRQSEIGFDQHGGELFMCNTRYRADSYRFRSTLMRKRPAVRRNLGSRPEARVETVSA